MYVARIPNRASPPAILLRESYREGGKVKKRTLCNLSDWPRAHIEGLRGVLKGDDKAAIEHKAEALAKVSAPVVQRAYQGEAQAAGAAPDASARAGAGPGKDDVLDAEFEEIKDKGPKSH